jgi:hypothetical protein
MQLSKSDPQTAYAKILLDMQKANRDLFDDEKMTDKEMRAAAKDAVTSFRNDLLDSLMKPAPGNGQQGMPPPEQESPNASPTGTINRGPVTGSKNYSNLWK